VADLSPLSPGFAHGTVHVGFVVAKVALGQFFFPPSISIFLCQCNFSRATYSCLIWVMSNWPVGGRSSETQSRPIDVNI
jgi:predicted amidohydrolase